MYFMTAMRRRKLEPGTMNPASRYGLAIVGLMIVFDGVLKILNGNLHNANYRGVLTFPPFVIIIGSLLVLLAIRSGK
jgi:hypothetical protein